MTRAKLCVVWCITLVLHLCPVQEFASAYTNSKQNVWPFAYHESKLTLLQKLRAAHVVMSRRCDMTSISDLAPITSLTVVPNNTFYSAAVSHCKAVETMISLGTVLCYKDTVCMLQTKCVHAGMQ